jgi:hypothetical protein
MAPALLAPAMMAKAESVAQSIVREMRQETTTIYINEELDICRKDQHPVFSLTVTPALISTIGAVGIAGLMIYLYVKGKLAWDPFGLSHLGLSGTGSGLGGLIETNAVTASPFLYQYYAVKKLLGL